MRISISSGALVEPKLAPLTLMAILLISPTDSPSGSKSESQPRQPERTREMNTGRSMDLFSREVLSGGQRVHTSELPVFYVHATVCKEVELNHNCLVFALKLV